MQNLHTHSTYVDGKLSPEEMIHVAIEKGFDSLGFAEHSYVIFDEDFSLTLTDTVKYKNEINALKKKYAQDIEIFLGLEVDYFTAPGTTEGLDFALGTAHHIRVKDKNGMDRYVTIDQGEEDQRQLVETYFDGDYYSFSEAFYETISDIAVVTNADIIGHFDLVTKYNYNNSIFDESHPRFLNAAIGAMEKILKSCKIFEINTGTMYRFNKPEPYPSERLIRELFKRGGEVILGSDSHDGDSLGYAFDEMSEKLKSIGFKYQKRLTKNGFIDVKL